MTQKEWQFVVEFVGHRGVGKSTLTSEVVRQLRDRGAPCNRLESLPPFRNLTVRLHYYVSLVKGFVVVATRRPISWTELCRSAKAYGALTRRLSLHRRSAGIHVLDEGVFQVSAMIQKSTRQPDLVSICRVLLRQVGHPNLVVVVEASRGAIEARRKLRGRPRDRLYQHVSASSVRTQNALKATIEDLSRSAPRMGYITVANEHGQDLRETARRISDEICERVHPGIPWVAG
jgi:AAA domain